MTPEEEFDSAAQAAEATLNQYPVESIELPGAFKTFQKSESIVSNAGVNAGTMAANIAASMRVLLATGLSTTGQEKQQFVVALLVLQAEYMDARNKAMQGTASLCDNGILRAQKAARSRTPTTRSSTMRPS